MGCGACVDVGGMSDGRDLAVKLFGRKIPLPEEMQLADKGVVADWAPLTMGEKDSAKEKANAIVDEQKTSTDTIKEADGPKPEQENKDTGTTGDDLALKKPDKVLQCPRCSSMDTKFCYYNNYNVNQPRYFCKNCQRYWTSGGTMRNVPVGAGRRKNKHSALSYRHTLQADAPDLIHHQPPPPSSTAIKKVNSTVLKFGADGPNCDSVASVLNPEEQKAEEPSCSSSVTASKHAENDPPDNAEQKSFLGYQNGVPPFNCFPVPPWAFAWNPAWSDAASLPWCQPPMVTAPAFCAPIPFPFVPASFWGCAPNWAAGGPWNLPVVGNSNGFLSPSASSVTASNCLLGKHCRDDATSSIGQDKPEKSLWVPKTLRVDDIDEAARSSIFSVLGINSDEDGVFKAFSSKKGEAALHANPAALSRSQAFQEMTS